jgi:hypothetical protein
VLFQSVFVDVENERVIEEAFHLEHLPVFCERDHKLFYDYSIFFLLHRGFVAIKVQIFCLNEHFPNVVVMVVVVEEEEEEENFYEKIPLYFCHEKENTRTLKNLIKLTQCVMKKRILVHFFLCF